MQSLSPKWPLALNCMNHVCVPVQQLGSGASDWRYGEAAGVPTLPFGVSAEGKEGTSSLCFFSYVCSFLADSATETGQYTLSQRGCGVAGDVGVQCGRAAILRLEAHRTSERMYFLVVAPTADREGCVGRSERRSSVAAAAWSVRCDCGTCKLTRPKGEAAVFNDE